MFIKAQTALIFTAYEYLQEPIAVQWELDYLDYPWCSTMHAVSFIQASPVGLDLICILFENLMHTYALESAHVKFFAFSLVASIYHNDYDMSTVHSLIEKRFVDISIIVCNITTKQD